MNLKTIASPAAIFVLICFFLPWITVSCSGSEISASGYDIASGNLGNQFNTGTQQQSSDPVLFLIPALGLIALGAYFLSTGTAKTLYLICGIVGLAVQAIKYFGYQSEVRNLQQQGIMIGFSYEIGWWLTLLAFGVLIFAGLMRQRVSSQT